MPAYDKQITIPDRWAIVAYVRALERSQTCPARRFDGGIDGEVIARSDPLAHGHAQLSGREAADRAAWRARLGLPGLLIGHRRRWWRRRGRRLAGRRRGAWIGRRTFSIRIWRPMYVFHGDHAGGDGFCDDPPSGAGGVVGDGAAAGGGAGAEHFLMVVLAVAVFCEGAWGGRGVSAVSAVVHGAHARGRRGRRASGEAGVSESAVLRDPDGGVFCGAGACWRGFTRRGRRGRTRRAIARSTVVAGAVSAPCDHLLCVFADGVRRLTG